MSYITHQEFRELSNEVSSLGPRVLQKEIIIHDKDLDCDLLLNAPLDDKIMAKVDLIVPKGLKIYDI